MTNAIKVAAISAIVGLPVSALLGAPPSEKRVIGTAVSLIILVIASQFDLLRGIADIFAWLLTVLIWLNDGGTIIQELA